MPQHWRAHGRPCSAAPTATRNATRLAELVGDLQQTFRPMAEQQALTFTVDLPDGVPDTITTDGHRVQQILKNLLSNAFKFTERGSVRLSVARVAGGARYFDDAPAMSEDAIAFAVEDTGIGIEAEKVGVIFEAFQQAEGTTTRKIIFLTAIAGQPEHYLRGYASGAVDYVYKPFEPEILRSKVAIFAELWSRGATIEAQREALAEKVVALDSAGAALVRQAVELERANAALDRLAQVAATDIREPLHTVAGFLDLLLDGGGAEPALGQRAPQQATTRLAKDPLMRRAAHRFVGDTLREWAMGDLTDTVDLLVSEVVTNAVVHAGSGVEVVVRLYPELARVEVGDSSAESPVVRHATSDATSGRGLALVEALSRPWGVDARPGGGKTVWFKVDRGPGGEEGGGPG